MKQVLGLGLLFALLLSSCQTTDLSDDEKFLESYSRATMTESAVITFDDGFQAGDIVTSVSPSGCGGEVQVFAYNPDYMDKNAAVIFDSNNPTGGDIDLGTPNLQYGGPGESEDSPDGTEPSNDTAQNNVLIIQETFIDGEEIIPDDSFIEGSYYMLDFSGYGKGYVTMESFLMIDLDGESKGEGTFVRLYDKDNIMLLEKEIMPMNDNGKQLVDLEDTEGVVKMVLNLNNSGAIDDITFRCENEISGCETIFAKADDGMCFNDTDPKFERWGWTNMISEGDSGSMELWGGAGKCDTGKGTLVGYLHYDYTGGGLTAEYDMMDGFYMKETHFYAGSAMYPEGENGKPTVAPGQYPDKNDKLDYTSSDSYTVKGLSGDIYLIAHGKVCGDFNDNDRDDNDRDNDDD